jgi:hypothetical protein
MATEELAEARSRAERTKRERDMAISWSRSF